MKESWNKGVNENRRKILTGVGTAALLLGTGIALKECAPKQEPDSEKIWDEVNDEIKNYLQAYIRQLEETPQFKDGSVKKRVELIKNIFNNPSRIVGSRKKLEYTIPKGIRDEFTKRILGVPGQESKFDVNALSDAGARGMWQIVPNYALTDVLKIPGVANYFDESTREEVLTLALKEGEIGLDDEKLNEIIQTRIKNNPKFTEKILTNQASSTIIAFLYFDRIIYPSIKDITEEVATKLKFNQNESNLFSVLCMINAYNTGSEAIKSLLRQFLDLNINFNFPKDKNYMKRPYILLKYIQDLEKRRIITVEHYEQHSAEYVYKVIAANKGLKKLLKI